MYFYDDWENQIQILNSSRLRGSMLECKGMRWAGPCHLCSFLGASFLLFPPSSSILYYKVFMCHVWTRWFYPSPSADSCLLATLRLRSGQPRGLDWALKVAYRKRPTPALEAGLGLWDGQHWSPGHWECGLEGEVQPLCRHITLVPWTACLLEKGGQRTGSEQDPPKHRDLDRGFSCTTKGQFCTKQQQKQAPNPQLV